VNDLPLEEYNQEAEIHRIKQENSRSELQDNELFALMMNFQREYFSDFTLLDLEVRKIFIDHIDSHTGKIIYDWGSLPVISLNGWLITREELEDPDDYGICDGFDITITIEKTLEHRELEVTILHEMIHAYQIELIWLRALGFHIRDFLNIFLFSKLQTKVNTTTLKNLIEIASSKVWIEDYHTQLFALKSFDLEIQRKVPFGSIYGNDKSKWFEEINSI
jgi:hypothetical protein